MHTREEIFIEVQKAISELFEVPLSEVTIESKLYEDLDLDSIDAVDLVVRLQEFTGGKIAPNEFKEVRTVDDVVNSVTSLLAG
jgi:acyl carrier protein